MTPVTAPVSTSGARLEEILCCSSPDVFSAATVVTTVEAVRIEACSPGTEIIEELAGSVNGGGMFKKEVEIGKILAAIAADDNDRVAGGGGVNGGLDNGVAAPKGGEGGGRLAMEVVVNTEDVFSIFSM